MLTMYNITDPVIKVVKSLNNPVATSIDLRFIIDETTKFHPRIKINFNSDFLKCNYAYISEFNLYYFVKIVVNDNQSMTLILDCDFLMSYSEDVLNLNVIVDRQENLNNPYFEDGSTYLTQVSEFTEIVNFPKGFNENGEFILITAGG